MLNNPAVTVNAACRTCGFPRLISAPRSWLPGEWTILYCGGDCHEYKIHEYVSAVDEYEHGPVNAPNHVCTVCGKVTVCELPGWECFTRATICDECENVGEGMS